MAFANLDFGLPKTSANSAQQKNNIVNYPSNFVGPVKPGQYIGGVNPLGTPAPSNLIVQPRNTQTNNAPSPSGGGGSLRSQMLSGAVPWDDNALAQSEGDMIKQRENELNAQLDRDYENAMSVAGAAEQNIQGQADLAGSQIANESAKIRTSLGEEQATRQQGIQSQLNTGQAAYKSNVQQARDLYRQTQQQNIAQLSALGISSSSVAEALAERLGVETARRIAGASNTIQEIQQNASNELARVNNYFKQKSTQLDEDERLQKQQIQLSLMEGLKQINAQRQQAASEKAARRADLLSQVNQQLYSLAQQKQQFAQQLQLWQTQKTQALQPIVEDQNYMTNFLANMQNLQADPAMSNYDITGSLNQGAKGQFTSAYQIQPKKKTANSYEDFINQAVQE